MFKSNTHNSRVFTARFRFAPPVRLLRPLLLGVGLILLNGCATQSSVRPGDPAYAPVMAAPSPIPDAEPGSIYRAGYGMELFTDRRARHIGDVITIVLNEQTVSQKTTNVSVVKDSTANFNAPNILGTSPSFKNFSLDTDIQQNRDFSGGADADQSNSLQGNISVTIADVLPNGNLIVRGEKWMTLNRGDEFIRLSGVIRPEDISPDNSVLSTKLANARISYSGTGELAESNRMGWLSRFFNSSIWPF